MLAYHYLAALELSRAAGLDITPLAVPAHRALREAGDRASALYAFEAAARFYGEALATAAMTEPELEFRHAQALFRSGNENGMRALEEAREALATAGASERAAEADALLAEGWWYVAERDRCFDHLARAEDVVRDSVPSSAKARVLSQVARYRALAGDYEQAIEAAEEALAIADQLGLDELRADALLNISLANAQRGHFVEAIAIARRAIEIALSINSPLAARGLNNLGAHLARSGDEQEGLRTRQEAIRVAERLGSPLIRRYSRGVITWHLYRVGRWDEAISLGDELISESEDAPDYTESYVRYTRALLKLARGDDKGAREDGERSVEIAKRARDAQLLAPSLGGWLRVATELGLEAEASAAAADLAREMSIYPTGLSDVLADALLFAREPLVEPLRAVVEQMGPTPWRAVAVAILDARYVDAADQLHEIGDQTDEAYARLRSGEPQQVERALDFFRSVGATRYIREAEALLAASA